uniref:G-protein coupled receptors family 1 profile domain-containing protein n=1 Tax=Strigamia maritima TaxID=126957 RepID=T1JMX2_STRMM
MGNPVNHSYFYNMDNVFNWGNRAYFTYYGEFGRPFKWVGGLEASLFAVVFIVSLIANACLAAVVLRYRELRTVTNFFIINLALADCLFAASIPLVAITRVSETWILGDTVCRLLLYFQFVCGAVLLWTLTMISLERYRCIVLHPMKSRLTSVHAWILILIIWLAFFVFFIPVALWFTVIEFPYGSSPVTKIKVCTLVFPNISWRISYVFITLTLGLTCLLPIVWLVFNYYSIFLKLRRNEQKWQELTNRNRLSAITLGASEAENLAAFDEVRHKKHCRTIKILILDVCITILMWSPIIVMMGLIHYDSSKNTGFVIDSCHFIGTLFIALANTCANPLLYGFLNTQFRRCLSDMGQSCWLKSCWFLFNSSSSDTSSSNTISLELETASKSVPTVLNVAQRESSVESLRDKLDENSKAKRQFKNLKREWSHFTIAMRDKIAQRS